MKWIPTVAIVVGFINCDQGPPPEPPPTTIAVAVEELAVEPEVVRPAEDALFQKPFLYQVTKQGNHRTSWVFGTLGAKFDVTFNGLPQSVKTAMTQSTHTMFEVPSGSAAHRDRTNLMPMKDGSVRREVGAARFKKLTEVTGHDSGVLDIMKPWVLHLAMEDKLAGNPPMDEAFEGFAQSYRKRMVYIETVPEEVAMLDSAIDFQTVNALIDGFEAHVAAGASAAEAYRTGSEEAVKGAVLPADDARTAVREKLITSRTPVWATKLGAQFDKDATFAVVGVQYLIGPNNLVDTLRANGWAVERVKY